MTNDTSIYGTDFPPGSRFSLRFSGKTSGKEYSTHAANGKIGVRLAGLEGVAMDMQLAYDFFKQFQHLAISEGSVVHEALWCAGVITYTKSFTQADGRKVTLREGDIFKGLLSQFKTEHQKLMSLRNQHFAHAGGLGLQQVYAYIIFDPTVTERRGVLRTWALDSRIPAPSWVENIISMISLVRGRLAEMKAEIVGRVYEEANFLPHSFDEPLVQIIDATTPGGRLDPAKPIPKMEFHKRTL